MSSDFRRNLHLNFLNFLFILHQECKLTETQAVERLITTISYVIIQK